MNYLVIEIQTSAVGTTSAIVDTYQDKAAAESKYYTILASACISNVPVHSAVIMTDEGFTIKSECYKHPV